MTAIIHLFACHVATEEWTLEQLADWVAEAEPKDETLQPVADHDHVFCAVHEG